LWALLLEEIDMDRQHEFKIGDICLYTVDDPYYDDFGKNYVVRVTGFRNGLIRAVGIDPDTEEILPNSQEIAVHAYDLTILSR